MKLNSFKMSNTRKAFFLISFFIFLFFGLITFPDTCQASSLSFDGIDDYVAISNSNDINLGIHDKRTIEAWFQVDDKTVSSRKQVIFEEGGGVRGLNIYAFSSLLYVGGWNASASESDWGGTYLSTSDISSNQWHHVVLTLEGTATLQPNAFKGYLDGVLFGSGDGSQIWEHSGNIMIGANGNTLFHDGSGGTAGDWFNGLIDEVRIYNTALSPGEISRHYHGDFSQDPTADLVALYHFDEGSGDTVGDDSGNGNDGTIYGDADWSPDSPVFWKGEGIYLVDIIYNDPSGGSGLAECEYTTVSGISPSCPIDGSWLDAPNCAPSCGGASCTCYDIPISIGPTGDCNINGTGACKVCSKATDGAGNTGYGEQSLNIDFAAPTVSVTGAPVSWQNTDATANVSCVDTLSGCDSATYKLKTYTTNPGTCSTNYADYTLTPPQTISSHLWVCGAAKDNVGNTGFSNPVEFKVDKIKPVSLITAPEAGSTQTADFNVSVTDTDTGGSGLNTAACYYRTYDSGVGWTRAWTLRTCNSNQLITVGPGKDCQTEGGTCTVYVYNYDNAGNQSDTNLRSFTIQIDLTPPTITINTLTGRWYNSNPLLDVDFADEKALDDGFYQVDSYTGTWTAIFTDNTGTSYTTDFRIADATWNGFADGSSHTIYFKATDDAGNQTGQDGSKPLIIKKDVSGPTVTVSGAPANWQNTDATASVGCDDGAEGSGCDATSYRLKTYTSAGACSTVYSDYTLSSPQTISSHQWLCTAAKDLVENEGFSPTRVEFKVDKEKPVSEITSPPADSERSEDFSVSVSDTDTGGSGINTGACYYYVFDSLEGQTRSSTLRACNFAQNITVSPTGDCRTVGGTCTVYVYTYDNAGNTNIEDPGSRRFKIVSGITPSTVETNPATDIQATSAQLNGNLTSLGGATSVDVWFVWDTEYHDNWQDYAYDTASGLEILRPNAVGDLTQFLSQYPDSGAHWDKVNEVTSDGDSTYIRGGSSGSNVPVIQMCVKENGVLTCKPDSYWSTTASYVLRSFQWSTKPSNGQVWTWADIDNLQIGIKDGYPNLIDLFNLPASSGQGTINYITVYSMTRYYWTGSEAFLFVTQVYVEVDYNASQSKTSPGPFNETITALSPGTIYHFRAAASNTAGTAYGLDEKFLTKPEPPTNLTATANSSTEIDLSWTAGEGADYTEIWRNESSCPTARGDGILLAGTTLDHYEDTGLDPDTTYCYGLWSIVSKEGFTKESDYSTGDQCRCETTEAEAGLVCNINVPTTGIIGQWIDINVSGSQGAIDSVKFSSDNILNGSPDGSWDGPYNWSTSSGNWDAISKIMKWSFVAAGTYEVWAELKDGTGEFSQCYDTIIITECYPGDTKSCTSLQGCSHTITCQANGTWPVCPEDQCVPETTQPCGVNGTQTCTATCAWGPCIEPDECPPPPPDCPICQHPECNTETNEWFCQLEPAGTDCSDCKECDEVGNCLYLCIGDVDTSCECIDDVCRGCVEYYDPGGPTPGYGFCEDWQTPVWSCVDGKCQYSCEGVPPPGCTRYNPEVYIYSDAPWYGKGNPGDSTTYTVEVWNKDTGEECTSSTFSLITGEYCDVAGWICSALPNLTIPANNQHDSTTLTVTSPSDAPSGNYDISVRATNIDYLEYFGTGYAIYQVANQPPEKPEIPLEYPGGVSWNHCSVQALSIPTFHWTYSDPEGNPQSAYEIRIDNDSDFSVVEDDEFTGSGGTSVSYTPLPSEWRNWMNWDTDYWWIVKVRDSQGNWSEWSDPTPFTAPLHAAPWPDFTPSPNRVSLNQIVTFEDNSVCYTYDFPSNGGLPCQSLNTSYEWDFDYIEPAFDVDDWTKGNAATAYGDLGNYKIKLRITDTIWPTDETTTCYSKGEITVTVTLPLPEWMEIPPF